MLYVPRAVQSVFLEIPKSATLTCHSGPGLETRMFSKYTHQYLVKPYLYKSHAYQRLEVSVDEIVLMHVLQSLGNLCCDGRCF